MSPEQPREGPGGRNPGRFAGKTSGEGKVELEPDGPVAPARWVSEHTTLGDVDRIRATAADLAGALEQCRRNVASAQAIAETNPAGAVTLSHDAARQAITTHMAAHGCRPANRPGAHRLVIAYAGEVLSDRLSTQDLDFLDRLRRTRADIEYEGIGATQSVAKWAAGLARHITSIVDAALEADRHL